MNCTMEVVSKWELVMKRLTPGWRAEISHELWGNVGGTWEHWSIAVTYNLLDKELVEECENHQWYSDDEEPEEVDQVPGPDKGSELVEEVY